VTRRHRGQSGAWKSFHNAARRLAASRWRRRSPSLLGNIPDHAYPVGSVRGGGYGRVVPRPGFPSSIVEFQRRFADEEACRAYLFASRWPDGFVCRRCGGGEVGVLQRRGVWQCTSCGKQTSITAGTVMHGSRLPLTLWFWAAYLVATHTPGMSAVQLKRQLALTRYETAWLMLHKLRRAMIAPPREPLTGPIEVDEGLVGGRNPRHRGRGHDHKALVGVAVEIRGEGSGRLRLQVLPDASWRSLQVFITGTIAAGSDVYTDGWQGYAPLARSGYTHHPHQLGNGHDWPLPRAHRALSNLKTWLQGTHRGVSQHHLQVYLDEFVFRHNRRQTPLAAFQTLLGLGTSHGPSTYRESSKRSQPDRHDSRYCRRRAAASCWRATRQIIHPPS
jgi:transposase-like protein